MKALHKTKSTPQEEAEFFQEFGFIGPFKLYEPDEARRILRDVRLKNVDRSKAIFDNDVNYDRHFDIPELSAHIGHPEIVRRVQNILGPDLFCWRTEFFPKFPGSQATEWHQVEEYKYTTGRAQLVPTVERNNTPFQLTAWTTFTESNKENGCLKFLPGSHKRWYFDESKSAENGHGKYNPVTSETAFYGYNYADFKLDPSWVPDESQAAAMIMEPGEFVIFTAKCVHGSYANTSKRSTRFAITARYAQTDVKIYPDTNEFNEHGGAFNLTNWGSVLVAGTDRFHYNRVRAENNLGQPFPTPLRTNG
jgi:non-heme Fe2+,alpha-ketoglutarate-dependent halogenase